jgi:hypothetical protein
MNQKILEEAKQLTDWLQTEDGVRYRWISLDENTITALRGQMQGRLKNIEPLVCKPGLGKRVLSV